MSNSKPANLKQTKLPFKIVKGSRVEKSKAPGKLPPVNAAQDTPYRALSRVTKDQLRSRSKKQVKRGVEKRQTKKQKRGIDAPDHDLSLVDEGEGSTAYTLTDGGEEVLGQEAHRTVFAVKVLEEDSSVFFEGKIPAVDKTPEAIVEARRKAANYPELQTSTTVRCVDGRPVLYYIKDGMFAGLSSDEGRDLANASVKAIQDLIKVYRPTPPKAKDSRVSQAQKETYKAKHQAFGRFMFTYWIHTGGKRAGPHLSSESKPASKKAMEQVISYMQATKWEHEQVAQWISALDPETHKELHECYQALGPEKLEHLYQGEDACHSGLALLVNEAVDPHKDSNDARETWTPTNCWGNFSGGCVAFPDLGIKINQQPGDLILSRAAVLTHFLEDLEDGERFCHVRFTKKDILRPDGKDYVDLKVKCPIAGCNRVRPSENALKKHLYGPTGQKRDKKSSCYHWLELEEAKALAKQAMATRQAEIVAEEKQSSEDIEMGGLGPQPIGKFDTRVPESSSTGALDG